MNNYDFRTKMGELGYRLRNDKRFRIEAYNKCQEISITSNNQKEIYFCNIIIKYIYGLDWLDRNNEKHKK